MKEGRAIVAVTAETERDRFFDTVSDPNGSEIIVSLMVAAMGFRISVAGRKVELRAQEWRERVMENGNRKEEEGENGDRCAPNSTNRKSVFAGSLGPAPLPKTEHIRPVNARLIVLDWLSCEISPPGRLSFANSCVRSSHLARFTPPRCTRRDTGPFREKRH